MRAERRHVRRHEALGRARLAAAALALGALAACGGVAIKPDPVLPRPLLQPLPSTVGLVLPEELRNYVHKETRWGVEWHIALGPGHVPLDTPACLLDRKSTRLNSSHLVISYAVFCLKQKQ